jgi:glyoxylase-like metal-dependent hydrolase (beta-lactamase superfamily II)
LCANLPRMTQRWTVGNVTLTSVIEDETLHVPPEFFFPDATAADVIRHPWLVPDYADENGNIGLRVQAVVVEDGDRTILVDPCVGHHKKRPLFFWNEMEWPFLERFAEAGFDVESIDTVVHTHLHADHVGWGTHLVNGDWVPTFTNARHLYTARELEYCRGDDNDGIAGVYADSVAPVIAAGLSEIVDEDADLGGGIRLEPTTGHTPGHVSMWIESEGERALISGDFLHHPVQCAEPHLAEIGDFDVDQARDTRSRMLRRVEETGALMLGTHFTGLPAGRVVAAGDVWRFEPVPAYV